MVELLKGNQSVIKFAIKNRPVAFVLIDNKLSILTDDLVRPIADFLHQQDREIENIEEARKLGFIKGKTAHKGKASGRVVVLSEEDYPSAKKVLGDEKNYILVTPMTRPELAAYFSDAIAFITDEGGITCHAAIVAREMNKPCIISTKFASKILTTGDQIEVDADNGIIRVI